ncbi:MAG: adenylyltransferase/cytidyltransferase family protein [Lentisphaeria bacterium]|nr:adenylyltransferase/cytidyltransferase family protein [Lentisphaeria bacterium]
MPKKVFVSGCFDMLHSGHVAFLQEAAVYGDVYVGLGSDHTIYELKNRQTINREEERLYMVKALRCVKDAWINSGSGIMDFEKEVRELRPDIFFVNTDGFTPAKEAFCRENGIRLIVSKRRPHKGLPARSTTAIRRECHIPYRVELCGGWLDQPFINQFLPGAVITLQIEPCCEFNDCSGMATSSRKKAIELWQTQIPSGDREKLARMLFCMENPPGTVNISGAQDQLGILLPGLNKLNFDRGYWPVSIETDRTAETLRYIREHLFLLPLRPRTRDYDVFSGKKINPDSIRKLAKSSEMCWTAIQQRDTAAWGQATSLCLEAQLEMFPNMATEEFFEIRRQYQAQIHGCKMTGSGGGGYMILISEKPLPNALQINPSVM